MSSHDSGLGPLLLRLVLLSLCVAVVLTALRSSAKRELLLPVEGASLSAIRNDFHARRDGDRVHMAIDIAAARGTPVLASTDGRIHRLSRSHLGGLGFYQIDPARGRCYYYGHLDRYAPGLEEGREVERGEVLGYVGSTGNASPDAPHLHFAAYGARDGAPCSAANAVNPYRLFTVTDP
jgi:murein DD-endopeptidase MepM/ murein hydrolase activator NlpD